MSSKLSEEEILQKVIELRRSLEELRRELTWYAAKVRRALLEAE